MIIYADFTSVHGYLASLRVDRLMTDGHGQIDYGPFDWRAVEHRPGLPRPGLQLSGTAQVIRGRELAAARCLLTPGEEFGARNPRFLPNTRYANVIYAYARAQGFGDEARRTLFDAYWLQGLHIGQPEVVDRVVDRLLPTALNPTRSTRTQTRDWQAEWLHLGTCVDLAIVSPHHTECGPAALGQLSGSPSRVA